jgi:hypothetical protein
MPGPAQRRPGITDEERSTIAETIKSADSNADFPGRPADVARLGG